MRHAKTVAAVALLLAYAVSFFPPPRVAVADVPRWSVSADTLRVLTHPEPLLDGTVRYYNGKIPGFFPPQRLERMGRFW